MQTGRKISSLFPVENPNRERRPDKRVCFGVWGTEPVKEDAAYTGLTRWFSG